MTALLPQPCASCGTLVRGSPQEEELSANLRALSEALWEIDGKDYYFRSREEIEGLREKRNFIVLDVRGDLQAVDLKDAERALAKRFWHLQA